MDDGAYKNVSLDSALLPDRDNPLLPTQYVPNAGIGALNIAYQNVATVVKPAGASVGSVTVAHPLGYVPTMLAFWVSHTAADGTPDALAPMPFIETISSGAAVDMSYIFTCEVDKDNVYFNAVTGVSGVGHDGARTASMQYFLLKKQGQSS